MLFKIGSINWKNTVENLLLIIITLLVGVYIGFKISIVNTEMIIEELKPTIEKAIDKESIKNTIHNAIDLKIDKIKKTDSLNININQTPDNKQKPVNVIQKDTVKPKKKKRKKFLGIF